MNALTTKPNSLFQLDLLPYAMKAKRSEKEIWDPTRRKWLIAEPEEIVRQGLIQFFYHEHGVDYSRMRAEWGFTYNGLLKRLDLIIFDKKGHALLISECKSWKTNLSPKALQQLGTYNTVLKAPYALLCNGHSAALIHSDHINQKASILTKWPDLTQSP